MRAPSVTVLLVAALLPAAAAPGARSSPLDGVRDAALLKGTEIGLGGKPLTPEKRTLGRVLSRLDRPRASLLGDLRAAGRVSRLLDRGFPGDPLLDAALEAALDALRDEILAERAALAAWRGRTGSDRGEGRLDRGILRIEEDIGRAGGTADRASRTRFLFGACRSVERTRAAIRLDAPPIGAPPFEGAAPDFALVDRNIASATFGRPVSPADFRGAVTAVYFLRAT